MGMSLRATKHTQNDPITVRRSSEFHSRVKKVWCKQSLLFNTATIRAYLNEIASSCAFILCKINNYYILTLRASNVFLNRIDFFIINFKKINR